MHAETQIRRPDTQFAKRAIADRDRHRALRAAWNAAVEAEARAAADVTRLDGDLAQLKAATIRITPHENALSEDSWLQVCAAWVQTLPFEAGLEILSDAEFVFVTLPLTEIAVARSEVLIDGDCNGALATACCRLVERLGWGDVVVTGPESDGKLRVEEAIRAERQSEQAACSDATGKSPIDFLDEFPVPSDHAAIERRAQAAAGAAIWAEYRSKLKVMADEIDRASKNMPSAGNDESDDFSSP